jgi:uncharacterized protein
MQKVRRNDPCPCGSGQKYKKCCESKSPLKKINAQLLTPNQASTVNALFRGRLAIPKPPEEKPTQTDNEVDLK